MRSLHRRLTISLLAAFTVLIAAGSGVLYWAMRASLMTQFDEGLRFKALVVITGTTQKKTKLDVRFSDHFLREFDDDIGTDFYQVRTAEGKNVERSDALNKDDLPKRFGTLETPEYWDMPLPGGRGAGRAIGITFTPRIDRKDEIAAANPIETTVVVARERKELDAMLRRLRIALATGGLGLLLATSLAVPIVLKPGLRPIKRVADLAQKIDATNLDQRFSTNETPSELRPICERLNDLLARLSASFARERRFSSDLAHELLTPIAEMRAIAESALKWPESASPDDYKQSVEIMTRMETLVTQVLDLARAENGSTKLQQASVDVAELARKAAQPYEALAKDRGVQLVYKGPAELTIESDAGVLHVIFGNLLSNAVSYTPHGSVVHISWNLEGEHFTFQAWNPAPQIEAEDLPQLFDRFWRKDQSRTESRHSGLGLSLATELAQVLGGKLTAEKTPDDDLVFSLTIPV